MLLVIFVGFLFIDIHLILRKKFFAGKDVKIFFMIFVKLLLELSKNVNSAKNLSNQN